MVWRIQCVQKYSYKTQKEVHKAWLHIRERKNLIIMISVLHSVSMSQNFPLR